MHSNARKHFLALAALSTLSIASSSAFAQSPEFNWYGRIDLALEQNNDGDTSRMSVNNFISRIGLRGEHKVSPAFSGIFQVETAIAPDDSGNSKAFASRNSFVGIKSGAAGTLILGNHDMPLKTLGGGAYNLWAQGDLEEVIIHGKASRVAIGSANFDNVHTRKTSMLQYTSPKLANAVVAKLAFAPDEGKKAATATVPAYGKAMWGASVEYNDGMFNAGLATQSQANYIAPTATADGSAMKAHKAVLGIKVADFTGGLLFSRLDNSAGRKTSNLMATGAYALGATTLRLSLGRSGESADNAKDAVSATALQVDHAFDKSLAVYGYFARLQNDDNAKGTFVASDNFPAVTAAGKDPRAFGVGLRYNF